MNSSTTRPSSAPFLRGVYIAAFAAPVAVLLLTAPAARWYARR